MATDTVLAPGARVLIRDEEWLVRGCSSVSTGGSAVRVVGTSELVRNCDRTFLSVLDDIEELRPEETALVADDSPQYRRSRLVLEALLRRTPPTDDRIHLGHLAAMNYAGYQMVPAHRALAALRPSILIADGVGIGKTLEVGVLLSELIKRGRGERILVVAIKSLLAQFQQELWTRFCIPLVRLDTVGLQRVRAKIPANKNPFYYYGKAIISIDTLKNDGRYRTYLEQCHWDVVVIDECHHVANANAQRNRVASLLARTSDAMIMTSATPHNGKPESFANLMNMLEPTAVADPKDYTKDEIRGLFVRRFKKDVESEVREHFRDRETVIRWTDASADDITVLRRMKGLTFHTLDRRSKGSGKMFDAYRDSLRSRNRMEWLDVIRETRRFLQRKSAILPYRSVVVDEAQDLHEEEWRLIRAIVPEGADDLFLVGDAHQRIYGRKIVLGRCGINIRGRSSTLRINYRTTEEIRNWAMAMLHDVSVDDLDGGIVDEKGYRSLISGPAPIVQQFGALDEERQFLVETVRDLLDKQGRKPEHLCVVARNSSMLKDKYGPALEGIPHVTLGKKRVEDSVLGVRLATMHRVKGLEFPVVILVGINDGTVPRRSKSKMDATARAEEEIRERCLLFVAATRARDLLVITSSGAPSEFLP